MKKIKAEEEKMGDNKAEQIIEKISELIPEEEGKVYAEAILFFLASDPFWNDKGEIVADSVTVENSNIVELIKHACSKDSTETPVGLLQFYHILATKVPIELVQNDNGVELMIRNRLPHGEQKGKGSDGIIQPKPKKRRQAKQHKVHLKPWITINDDRVF